MQPLWQCHLLQSPLVHLGASFPGVGRLEWSTTSATCDVYKF